MASSNSLLTLMKAVSVLCREWKPFFKNYFRSSLSYKTGLWDPARASLRGVNSGMSKVGGENASRQRAVNNG